MKTGTVCLSDILLTALAPMIWGTTYVVATELLPPNHPLLVAILRSLAIALSTSFHIFTQSSWFGNR
ncbi:DNA polymerase III subunit psi [Funiculus sociatus GB2-M2]|nr:DNA polymerase III subunit psi [Trichocoleus sp. FACHB-90]